MKISEILRSWYNNNARDLPWRMTSDPYLIWMSEIILQQTRVNQGMDYYLVFAKRFPKVSDLASAEEQEVLKLWQGLGYYSRARNMHYAAKQVMQDFGGRFPSSYGDLLKLKGVGPYTAAAVTSIATGAPESVVDGNVMRVLSRLFNIHTPVNSPDGQREISELAKKVLDRNDPGNHNQALMEFGAMHCTPRNPDCGSCPLDSECMALSADTVLKLPVKLRNSRSRTRYFYYFVILEGPTRPGQKENEDVGKMQGQSTYIRKRNDQDIWRSLWEFPMIEKDTALNKQDLIRETTSLMGFTDAIPKYLNVSGDVRHRLSHQTIIASFVEVRLGISMGAVSEDWVKIEVQDIHAYPVPRLIENYLDQAGL